MATWAAAIALVLAAVTYLVGGSSTLLSGLAEIGAVLVLFGLVCATEALN